MNTSSINLAQLRTQTLPARASDAASTPDYVRDRRQYQRIYVLCFAIFLVVALVCRVLPRAWRPFANAEGKRSSVIDEVRNAVSTVLPFVFMA